MNKRKSRSILADIATAECGVLQDLSGFDPQVVSTIRAGLDVEGSDIDIICAFDSSSEFVYSLRSLPKVATIDVELCQNGAVVGRFSFGGFDFEIYGSTTPVREQFGYRHFVVMQRLVAVGGEKFQESVRRLKRSGLKTEPAIATYLGLPGNPYNDVSALYEYSDSQLRELVCVEA